MPWAPRTTGARSGTFGDLATGSFYPAHHITMGEGGACSPTSRYSKKLVEIIPRLGPRLLVRPGQRQHLRQALRLATRRPALGYDHKYTYSHIGYNLKATDMQAAVGVAQLEKLRRVRRARRAQLALPAATALAGLRNFSSCRRRPPGRTRVGSASRSPCARRALHPQPARRYLERPQSPRACCSAATSSANPHTRHRTSRRRRPDEHRPHHATDASGSASTRA